MVIAMTERQREDDRVTALALKAGRGDRAALTEFIRSTQGDVWRLLAHLANTDVADDLTQETYLRVMSALPRFAARSSARTWLLSLARRVWVDSVRHDMARPRKSAVEWEDATQASSTGTSWAELVDARVLMESLDADRREALILTQVLGYTYAEAADIAGVRVGTIRSRVARARQDLVAASEIRGAEDSEGNPADGRTPGTSAAAGTGANDGGGGAGGRADGHAGGGAGGGGYRGGANFSHLRRIS